MSEQSLGEIGKVYLSLKKEEKDTAERISELRATILNIMDKRKELKIKEDGISFVKEIRTKKTLNNNSAVLILEQKGLKEHIQANASISIREGVEFSSIPSEVVNMINTYFDVKVTRTVELKDFENLILAKVISEAEAEMAIEKNETVVLKVS